MSDNVIAPDMQEFIDKHRRGLVGMILDSTPNLRNVDDDCIEDHVTNVEHMYNWARSEGVDV